MNRERRSMKDRRGGKERRRIFSMQRLFFNDVEKRGGELRKDTHDRRHGWVRLGRWSSAHLADLKIGKFLKR